MMNTEIRLIWLTNDYGLRFNGLLKVNPEAIMCEWEEGETIE